MKKRDKLSGKGQKMYPFKKGDVTKYGTYLGKRFGEYLFGSEQHDDVAELVKTVSPHDERVIEMLIRSKK